MGFGEWFTIITGIIGVAAFLMATQPFVQMIWGSPKITIKFGYLDLPDTGYLDCQFRNEPIQRGILKFMRITRNDAKDPRAWWGIEEAGSRKSIHRYSKLTKIKTQSGEMQERILLPESFFFASFAIVATNKASNTVNVFCDSGTPKILAPGLYIASVEIMTGIRKYRAEKTFLVQSVYPFAYWTSS